MSEQGMPEKNGAARSISPGNEVALQAFAFLVASTPVSPIFLIIGLSP